MFTGAPASCILGRGKNTIPSLSIYYWGWKELILCIALCADRLKCVRNCVLKKEQKGFPLKNFV